MTPKISIIIPIYNSSVFLKKCLKSLQNQTFKDFEVILINDGSTDNSLTICNEFSELDNRFKVFTQINSGVSSARNNGLKKSLGKYIAFVDSDDWVEKDFCEILLNNIIIDDYDLVVCGYKTYFSSDNIIADSNNLKSIITHDNVIKSLQDYKNNTSRIFGNTVWAKLFRRNIIIDNCIEFINGLRIGEDLLFVLEYQKHINLAFCIPDKLYNYNRISDNSVTISYVKNYWEDLIFFKKKTFEINEDIVQYTDEYKYYQYIRVASKAILEEGKLNNGKKFNEKYKSIKELCNKSEVRHFCDNYKLPNEKDKFNQLIRKLIKLNMPFLILIVVTLFNKFRII